jgi:hypothetical protein
MAVYHDQADNPDNPKDIPPVVIADNIEDMQLYYFYNDEEIDNSKIHLDPGISTTKLKDFRVKAVTLGLTSKASYSRSGSQQVRPALFNREAGTMSDNFNRQLALETILLRNAQ